MNWDQQLSHDTTVRVRVSYRNSEERPAALRHVTEELTRRANHRSYRTWSEPISEAKIALGTVNVPPMWDAETVDGYAAGESYFTLDGTVDIRVHPSESRIQAAKDGVGYA